MNKKFGFQDFIDMIFSTTTTRVSWKVLYKSKLLLLLSVIIFSSKFYMGETKCWNLIYP